MKDPDDLFSSKYRTARRRMLALRKHFYRPVIEDYDYYEYDPVIPRRFSARRRLIQNDRLWPIHYGIVGHARPVVAAPQTSNDITSPDDYNQLVDSDSVALPATSLLAEVHNYLPPVTTFNNANALNGFYNQRQHAEAQPAFYPNVQYSTRRVYEPKAVQHSVPLYTGTAPHYFETLQCFSGDTTVQTPYRIKRIDELQIGDQVLSIEESFISYSPVVMFLHRSHNESAIFNKIILKSGEMVKVTDYHLLYVTECMVGEQLRLIFAKDVRLGHCLHVAKKQSNSFVPIQISSIQKVTGKGIFAPLTATGDIVVNSILSSCHCNIFAQTLQQSLFTFLKKFTSLLFGEDKTGLLPGIELFVQISHLFVPQSIAFVW